MSDWRKDYENNGPGVNPGDYGNADDFFDSLRNSQRSQKETKKKKSGGCYVATCVYGSYDCPQVWTLRRYRDSVLKSRTAGRMFIRFYYSAAPIAVRLFGKNERFRSFFRKRLDRMVMDLNEKGISDAPYSD